MGRFSERTSISCTSSHPCPAALVFIDVSCWVNHHCDGCQVEIFYFHNFSTFFSWYFNRRKTITSFNLFISGIPFLFNGLYSTTIIICFNTQIVPCLPLGARSGWLVMSFWCVLINLCVLLYFFKTFILKYKFTEWSFVPFIQFPPMRVSYITIVHYQN